MKEMNPLRGLSRYNVALASNSPRRRELLSMLDIDFKVEAPKGIDETLKSGIPVAAAVEELSRRKVCGYMEQFPGDRRLAIAADTVVVADGEVLGKPESEQMARDVLRKLSGRRHTVITGVAVATDEKMESCSATTAVEFAHFTDEEIGFYVDCYHPLDKAGAYGIQEWIGCIGVSRIEGSFYNVMGLPLHRLYRLLSKFC